MRWPIAAPAAACARVIIHPGLYRPARGYHASLVFQSLSDKLQATLGDLRSRGALSAEDIDRAMREIRLALLEADVNFRVVKTFVAAVRERAVGQEVLSSLTPGQQVVKIVDEELTELLGAAGTKLTFASRPPTVILLCGLQGSGKTTAAGKLASLLTKQGHKPALVACDLQRPAAVEQLKTLGRQVDVPVFERGAGGDPVSVARYGIEAATSQGRDVVILDTAGRLHVDSDLMDELVRVRDATKPQNVLMVLDAMTGQDAVNVAEQFLDAVAFDGVVLTKLDGDARGGAALSVRAVTGKPIIFASVGEKLDQLEEFHPDRMASRILGMGDVLTLIERAQEQIDEGDALELERKLKTSEFGLDDLLDQLRRIRKMGSLRSLLGMIPGIGKQVKDMQVDDKQLDRVEAMILSMTPSERRNPQVIDGSRRRRIASGSGTSVQQVNQLLQQHRQMKKMMKQVASGKTPNLGGPQGAMATRPRAAGARNARKKRRR
jgi:signal recognition particle subunit SRP54